MKHSQASIEAQVTSLLGAYGYDTNVDGYFDIIDLVKYYGFLVGTTEMPDSMNGFIAVKPDSDSGTIKVIGVNRMRSLECMRAAIAHEFGYYVLNYTGEETFLHTDHQADNDESAAYFFATAVLMPKDSFKRLYIGMQSQNLMNNTIVLNLATTFKVTDKMVRHRILGVSSIV